eukprot:UN02159
MVIGCFGHGARLLIAYVLHCITINMSMNRPWRFKPYIVVKHGWSSGIFFTFFCFFTFDAKCTRYSCKTIVTTWHNITHNNTRKLPH